ncbi:hypothetical protein CFN78_06750 [Amycolatopsis antarctica]|uniref:Uncharacterized protein n=1 Tax=Amycolatopsis antarctica TaxID=1854586 RepID=A0A263D6H9_9PSEU|nr:hypothetical protein [Amycolatopsis antarctica]OZM73981.1 hypothetical protein CFN78_06750 [Amycolatopsis antarctica]
MTRDRYPRRTLSFFLALGQLAFATVWLAPALHSSPSVPGRVSVISELNDWWPWLFGVAGLSLLAATTVLVGQQVGHSLCAASCGGYAAAGWIGALSSTPITNLTTALAFTLLAGAHFLVSAMYREAA